MTVNNANFSVLLGVGDGTFRPAVNYAFANGYGADTGSSSSHSGQDMVALADLNRDSKLDIVVDHFGTIYALLNRGDGTFPAARSYDVNPTPLAQQQFMDSSLTTADLNHDGKPDLIALTTATVYDGSFSGVNNAVLAVLVNNGDGTFRPAATYDAGQSKPHMVVGDFNNDGNPDVLVQEYNPSPAALFLGNGDGSLRGPINFNPSFESSGLWLAGDVNGDGNLDLIEVGNVDSATVEVALGKGDGTFQTSKVGATLSGLLVGGPPVAVTGDFNGDGKLDLALVTHDSGYHYFVSVLLGKGDGTYQAAVNYTSGRSPAQLASGDFNGDGKQDLAALNTDGTVSLLVGNGDGTFQQPILYDEPLDGGAGPLAFLAADVNGDGAPDLVIAGSNSLVVLLHGGRSLSSLVADAPLTAAGTAHRATTAAPFSGVVATFTDANPEGALAQYTATIAWGDGSTSAGTVLANPAGGFLVTGTDAYKTTGTFNATVSIADRDGAGATATTTIAVDAGPDAALTASGTTIDATARLPFTGTVATFTDGDPAATAGDFLAAIAWGDGQTTLGIVTADPGGFTVNGTHTYAAAGTYPVAVAITDTGGATAGADSSADVAPNTDAPLTARPVAIQATAAAAFTGVVATFIDADPAGAVLDYLATIHWGDGQTSAGTVTADPVVAGRFDVTGSNTYVKAGTFPVAVAIADRGGAGATATSTADVAHAPLTAQGTRVAATEGMAFAGLVATFTDADPYGTAGEYTATITWGDGQSSVGTVTADPSVAGQFDVTGSNTYADEGVFPVTVLITDGSSATAVGLAIVADAPLKVTAAAVSATEGTAFSGLVATFADANPGAAAGDFTATIAWGDGYTSPGTIGADPNGGFDVRGSNTYAVGGTDSVRVAVVDAGGSTGTDTGKATVFDPPPVVTGRVFSGPVEGAAFIGVVASFVDPVPGGTASNYAATIDWGDGQTSLGALIAIPVVAGGFNVSGTHTYAEAGSYSVIVTIMDVGGASASAASTAVVADAPLTATGASLNATEGISFTGVIATFKDADPNAAAGMYTATIDWGGGQTSTATVTADPLVAGRFDVVGGSTYAEEGTDAVTVAITDRDGATATATGTVVVGDAPLVAAGTSVAATAGVPFTARVGTFTDANPGAAAGDFTATIDWGDGFTSPGTIIADGGSATGDFVLGHGDDHLCHGGVVYRKGHHRGHGRGRGHGRKHRQRGGRCGRHGDGHRHRDHHPSRNAFRRCRRQPGRGRLRIPVPQFRRHDHLGRRQQLGRLRPPRSRKSRRISGRRVCPEILDCRCPHLRGSGIVPGQRAHWRRRCHWAEYGDHRHACCHERLTHDDDPNRFAVDR